MSKPSSLSERRAPTNQGEQGNFFNKRNCYQTRTQDNNFSIVASFSVYDDDDLSMEVSKHLTSSLSLAKNESICRLLNCSHTPARIVWHLCTEQSSARVMKKYM